MSVGGKELEVGRSGLSSSQGLLENCNHNFTDYGAPNHHLKLLVEERPVVIRDLYEPLHEPLETVNALDNIEKQNSLIIGQKRKSGVFKASQIHELLADENRSLNN